MASRKSYRGAKSIQNKDYSALNISDVLCPICRSIFLVPVTLPCNHSFCNSCLEGTVKNTNLVCPLCRLRIGSWLRKAKKEHKLVNAELWKTINDKFPQQVKNRISGIDEVLEQEPVVVVSNPGEIRKEYEQQKQKDDEEIEREREKEMKASEELIMKIKQEEDYEDAMIKEKIKNDEELAKKLAEEYTFNSPSTSGLNMTFPKKLGPMDKFLKKDNETVTSQNQNNGRININNNFANKEYTCKFVFLEKKQQKLFTTKMTTMIRKQIRKIQKLSENDANSDSSDCIESEMRYFKPIDHRINPPSQGKSPIKIPSRKPLKNGTNQILSPSGLINFHSNMIDSAFVRISLSLPAKIKKEEDNNSSFNETHFFPFTRKRNLEDDQSMVPYKKLNTAEEDDDRKSPLLTSLLTSRRRLFDTSITSSNDSSSSPFFGFDSTIIKNESIDDETNNGVESNDENKLRQEKEDLEYAKQLQEEFNRSIHNTRSSERRQQNFRIHKRQTTLEELMNNSYRVKR